jgi:hypothetical protein
MVPELVRLATEAENEATRLGAIREIFDRAIGKAAQQIEGKMQVGGAPEPIRYEVALAFDPSHDDVPARISGVTPDDSALVP